MKTVWPLLAVLLLSCGDDPQLGENGGGCRTGPDPCDGTLVCDQGQCVSADEVTPDFDPEDYAVQLTPERTYLWANGEDSMKVSFIVLRRDNGKPYQGAVVLRTHPIEAGRFQPAQVALEGGRGSTTFVPCNAVKATCPQTFVIVLALAEEVTVPLAETVTLRLQGTEPLPDGGAGGSGGSGGTGGYGGDGTGGTAGSGGTPTQEEFEIVSQAKCRDGAFPAGATVEIVNGVAGTHEKVAFSKAQISTAEGTRPNANGIDVPFYDLVMKKPHLEFHTDVINVIADVQDNGQLDGFGFGAAVFFKGTHPHIAPACSNGIYWDQSGVTVFQFQATQEGVTKALAWFNGYCGEAAADGSRENRVAICVRL